jgi:putative DNA primase/helicase
MTWANYDDVLDQLRGAGLLVDHIVTGRVQRCRVEGEREKRGWYKLSEHRSSGGDFLLVGSYGVWRGADNGAQRIELSKHKITDEERAALRKRQAEDRRAAEAERKATAARAAEVATKTWAKLSSEDCDDHAYIKRKGVRAWGVKVSKKGGGLAVPMCDGAGRIHGLQIIRAPSARQRKLDKEFWPAGLAKAGHYHLIGRPEWVVLIAEGYATAASLFEATQLPVAVAFDAGNLKPVGEALAKRYPRAKQLYCADDDSFASCLACAAKIDLDQVRGPDCPACGQPHQRVNTGVAAASVAALATKGAWMMPAWTDAQRVHRTAAWIEKGSKLTDFNDLHAISTLHDVGTQVQTHLTALGWRPASPRANTTTTAGEGREALKPIAFLDELLERFALVYGQGGTVFDQQEHRLLSLSDMRDACMRRELARAWQEHPDRRIVRVEQVGFDPGGDDPQIICNLWAGWPTRPKAGNCDKLLTLLWYMTARETAVRDELYRWVLCWLAYPIQHAGAKMRTALVVHGPQGTGKNLFFEAYMAIFGPYGRVIDQAAIEDKFNDSFSRKLLLLADEVIARSELYHVKNKLKHLITGDWIRINPKNLAAYDERNHVNLIFLSNETLPVVLERDDRRYAVIWTPDALPQDFYAEVRAEIAAGGIEALHEHLLTLNIGDFQPGTRPPMTDAKRELIDQSLDSTSRFYLSLAAGDVGGVPLVPCLSDDLYELYRTWAARNGHRAAPHQRLVSAVTRQHGGHSLRRRIVFGKDQADSKPLRSLIEFQGNEPPPGGDEAEWYGQQVAMFREKADLYRGTSKEGAYGKS